MAYNHNNTSNKGKEGRNYAYTLLYLGILPLRRSQVFLCRDITSFLCASPHQSHHAIIRAV